MFYRLGDLKNKYVINVRNGSRLGYAADIEIDTASAMVTSIIIKGKLRFFGLLGREEDIVVQWQEIEVIGEDAILVNHELPDNVATGARPGGGLFRILSDD